MFPPNPLTGQCINLCPTTDPTTDALYSIKKLGENIYIERENRKHDVLTIRSKTFFSLCINAYPELLLIA